MTSNDFIESEIQQLLEDPPRLAGLGRGISDLKLSNVFAILREFGKVQPVAATPELLIFEAGRSRGYNEALEDIERFFEKYIQSQAKQTIVPAPEYGGLDLAVEQGDLTKEEANVLRKSAATAAARR